MERYFRPFGGLVHALGGGSGALPAMVRTLLLVLVGSALPGSLASCTYCPPQQSELCALIGKPPLAELTSSERTVVFEQPGTIIVFHGSGCARSDKSGEEDILAVEETLELPPYATNATVILNGWRLQYLDGDHNVTGLGTVIKNIRIERNTLKWEAAGAMSDKNFDDGYSWCYRWTVVAWNPSQLALLADHKNDDCGAVDPSETNFFVADNSGTTTAAMFHPTFLRNPGFAAGAPVALLPRGFGFGWTECGADHHLLQVGYAMGHHEKFVENARAYRKGSTTVTFPLPDAVSEVDPAIVAWESAAVFKDNDARRGYEFGELVSGLSGEMVGVIHPPFSVLPIEDESGLFDPCVWSGGANAKEFIIRNIPFRYAIPMLTGWDLGFGKPTSGCNDENVRDIGVWIDGWSYSAPAGQLGTLSYKLSAVLADEDGFPGPYQRHRVSILGFVPVVQKPPIPGPPVRQSPPPAAGPSPSPAPVPTPGD